MSDATNKDLAIAFVERFRAFMDGERGVPTFSPYQLASITAGLRDQTNHMIQFIGDIGQHISQILTEDGESATMIVDAVLNCQKMMVGILISYIITTTRPDLVAQSQQDTFSWEEEFKGLDFKMPQIGTLQLDK